VGGVERVRVSYLQPAELKPGLVRAIATTPGVASYFDLSFQHSSEPVLRRMRRFGSTGSFLALIEGIRALAPRAGVRSNVIVGFPGETADDLAELRTFLTTARLDAVGVFGYSDEDGTEAEGLDGKLDPDEIAERVAGVSDLIEQLTWQRAEERLGSRVVVLAESAEHGRAEHQGPEDGDARFTVNTGGTGIAAGDLVLAEVVAVDGVDLLVEPLEPVAHPAAHPVREPL